MAATVAIIGAILQIVLLLLQSHYSKEAEVKTLQANKAKDISDAIASGDVSRINAAVCNSRK